MQHPLIIFFITSIALTASAQTKRPLQPSDYLRYTDVTDPQVSPDGKWVVYTVSKPDTVKDETISHIWMTSWDGTQTLQLTYSKEGENTPRFSPDGKYISFLSGRYADEKNDQDQLWLMNRLGGEAWKITNTKSEIEDYDWSPNSEQLVIAMKDIDEADTSENGVRDPYVINRYHFKEDIEGYLDDRKTHLYLLNIENATDSADIDTLTSGRYNETEPRWRPDGKQIVFVSNHSADADLNENDDLFVMEPRQGAQPIQITTWQGADHEPQWSPDGNSIAYLQSSSKETFTMYGQDAVTVISKNGGQPKYISQGTDRVAYNPRWSKDGKTITALIEDDLEQQLVSFDVASGKSTKLTAGKQVLWNAELNTDKNEWLVSMTNTSTPTELYTVTGNKLQRITHQTDSFTSPLQTVLVDSFVSISADSNTVHGLLYRSAAADKPQPLILYIHGGPVAQDDYEFDMERNTLAAAGFTIAAVNYRGSSGRGNNYIRAIFGDWGNKEVKDIMGAMHYLVKKGIADSTKIGIAGWSYGGILTDYCIATDTIFKAASSGAGSALQLSMYGVDEYITQYEAEIGPPWKNKDKWIDLSYAFFHSDKIKTPTLFMGGQSDFNVPVSGGEQMYQALRSQGIPTELIIYPKQFHELKVPTYMEDRFQRYINWFNKYLK